MSFYKALHSDPNHENIMIINETQSIHRSKQQPLTAKHRLNGKQPNLKLNYEQIQTLEDACV